MSGEREKMDRPQNWLHTIGWKAFFLAEEVTPFGTRVSKKKKITTPQWFYCNVTGSFKKSSANIDTVGHLYS